MCTTDEGEKTASTHTHNKITAGMTAEQASQCQATRSIRRLRCCCNNHTTKIILRIVSVPGILSIIILYLCSKQFNDLYGFNYYFDNAAILAIPIAMTTTSITTTTTTTSAAAATPPRLVKPVGVSIKVDEGASKVLVGRSSKLAERATAATQQQQHNPTNRNGNRNQTKQQQQQSRDGRRRKGNGRNGKRPKYQQRKQLTCTEIQKLEIIRTVGRGKNKIVYEVRMPHTHPPTDDDDDNNNDNKALINNGTPRMVAKRCYSIQCYKLKNSIKREAVVLEQLQHQYGPQHAIQLYGTCSKKQIKGKHVAILIRDTVVAVAKNSSSNSNHTNNSTTATTLTERTILDTIARNFSRGFTSVMELATPLLSEYDGFEQIGTVPITTHRNNNNSSIKLDPTTNRHLCHSDERKCFASYFTIATTTSDTVSNNTNNGNNGNGNGNHRHPRWNHNHYLEDFKSIARQYANYSYGPLVLRNPSRTRTDNCKFEQYILSSSSSSSFPGSPPRIYHGDLDMVVRCDRNTTIMNNIGSTTRSKTNINGSSSSCSYEEALEINCSVLRTMLHDSTLNCSEGSNTRSSSTKEGKEPRDLNFSLSSFDNINTIKVDIKNAKNRCRSL